MYIKAVYGNDGSQEDLVLLESQKAELNGNFILLRATGQVCVCLAESKKEESEYLRDFRVLVCVCVLQVAK